MPRLLVLLSGFREHAMVLLHVSSIVDLRAAGMSSSSSPLRKIQARLLAPALSISASKAKRDRGDLFRTGVLVK